MFETITTIISTGVVLAGAIGAILKAFYKTNKECKEDFDKLEAKFNHKLEKLQETIKHDTELKNQDVKDEFKIIGDKIDDMKTRYVTNENFKTYADSISQLLKMFTDRMSRIETTLDDIRDDISLAIQEHRKNKDL